MPARVSYRQLYVDVYLIHINAMCATIHLLSGAPSRCHSHINTYNKITLLESCGVHMSLSMLLLLLCINTWTSSVTSRAYTCVHEFMHVCVCD